MKYFIFWIFLAFSMLLPHLSSADPDSLCSTTIKCLNGIATCSAKARQYGNTSAEVAICGTASGNFRTCSFEYTETQNGKVVRNEDYICCTASGEALSMESPSSLRLCASPGTVQ